MTPFLYPLALTAGFIAAALTVYAAIPRERPMAPRSAVIQAVERSRFPLWLRLVYPLSRLLAPLAWMFAWPSYRTRAARLLRRAGIGDALSVDHLLAIKLLSACLVPLAAAKVFALWNPAVFVAGMVGAFYLPDLLVADMRKKRERQIVRALPGAVDMLSLSVEAGLEFLLALQRQVERGSPGPLRDELTAVLNDIRLGRSRGEALRDFATRLEIPEISSFVSVLVQADALGASIGTALKSQAERIRADRFQKAEREGAKAAQKILFPLVLCIFPAVLIVILGPTILRFIYGGGI